MLNRILAFVFRCSHRRLSSVFGNPDKDGTYVVCLDCGRGFRYDWKAMRLTGPLTPGKPGHKEAGPHVLLMHPPSNRVPARPDLRNPLGPGGSRRAERAVNDRVRTAR